MAHFGVYIKQPCFFYIWRTRFVSQDISALLQQFIIFCCVADFTFCQRTTASSNWILHFAIVVILIFLINCAAQIVWVKLTFQLGPSQKNTDGHKIEHRIFRIKSKFYFDQLPKLKLKTVPSDSPISLSCTGNC